MSRVNHRIEVGDEAGSLRMPGARVGRSHGKGLKLKGGALPKPARETGARLTKTSPGPWLM